MAYFDKKDLERRALLNTLPPTTRGLYLTLHTEVARSPRGPLQGCLIVGTTPMDDRDVAHALGWPRLREFKKHLDVLIKDDLIEIVEIESEVYYRVSGYVQEQRRVAKREQREKQSRCTKREWSCASTDSMQDLTAETGRQSLSRESVAVQPPPSCASDHAWERLTTDSGRPEAEEPFVEIPAPNVQSASADGNLSRAATDVFQEATPDSGRHCLPDWPAVSARACAERDRVKNAYEVRNALNHGAPSGRPGGRGSRAVPADPVPIGNAIANALQSRLAAHDADSEKFPRGNRAESNANANANELPMPKVQVGAPPGRPEGAPWSPEKRQKIVELIDAMACDNSKQCWQPVVDTMGATRIGQEVLVMCIARLRTVLATREIRRPGGWLLSVVREEAEKVGIELPIRKLGRRRRPRLRVLQQGRDKSQGMR